MTRSALDAALLLQVLAGHDPLDPTSVDAPVPDYARETTRPVRRLRVGVPRGYLWDLVAPAIGTAVEVALDELRRLGFSIEDVEIPEWEAAADASLVLIRSEAATEYRRVLMERPHDLIPDAERLEAGVRTSALSTSKRGVRRTASRTPSAGSSPGRISWPFPGAPRRRPRWTRAGACWSRCPRETTPRR
jgi:aspartyl-tRNA(Asn)/glutamyl-tRNA(Gln) amidotransferase subunit A